MFLPKLSDTDTCIWKQETVKRGNQYKGDQGKPESTCMHAGIVIDHSIKTAKRCKVMWKLWQKYWQLMMNRQFWK